MTYPTFQAAVRAASAMAPSEGRSKLVTTLHTAKLEWDEDERKRLRKHNKDGFLLVPEGAVIGAHLNLKKLPFFNLKQPRKYGGASGFPSETLGHVRALMLKGVHFYVGSTGSKTTAKGGKSKSPYAGPVGTLVAVELPEGSFGKVPKSGANETTFNPRRFPAWDSLFFCLDGDAPVKGASSVVMRDWRIWANGPRMMPDKEIDALLEKLDMTREDVGSGGRVASFIQQNGVRPSPTFNDDPKFWAVRNDLIRIAYTNPETRKALLPLLTE